MDDVPANPYVVSGVCDGDWECYWLVVVKGLGLGVVGGLVGMSGGDVGMAVGRVRGVLGELNGGLGLSVFERSEVRRGVVHRMEGLWDEAMRAWRQSQVERVKEKRVVGDDGGVVEERETVTSAGDVRYLGEARELLRDMREMLSLDEVVKGGGGGQRPVINVNTQVVASLPMEQRDAVRNAGIILDKGRGLVDQQAVADAIPVLSRETDKVGKLMSD